jgi:hypothetical protein
MQDYVFHIGPPKTGTTYLQRGFTRLADQLGAQGILYPRDLGSPGHIKLARQLAQPDAEATLAPVFASMAQSGARVVLISAEDLSPLRHPAIQTLRTLTGDSSATVIYYCRRWSDIVRSRWGERVKHGSRDTLQEQCTKALETPFQTGAINYGRTLRRWNAHFGRAALRLVALETLAETNTEIGAHFLSNFLGLEMEFPLPDGPQNPSMPLVETEILRALNAIDWQLHQQGSSAIRQAFVRHRDTLDLTRTEAAIETDLTEVIFDETAPRMIKLQKSLFAEYSANVVAPHKPDLFFTPRRAVLQAASGAFTQASGVGAELQAAYDQLRAFSQRGEALKARSG